MPRANEYVARSSRTIVAFVTNDGAVSYLPVPSCGRQDNKIANDGNSFRRTVSMAGPVTLRMGNAIDCLSRDRRMLIWH